jgi:protein-disulfide isomerase
VPRPAPTPRRSSLTPFYIVLGLVLLAGLGVLATQLIHSRGEGANQGVAVTLTPDQLQRVRGISRGRADAPITIYEFADFQCPHCAEFAWKLEPLIRDSLVNTGKARYVYYEMPLGFKWSFLSARSGRCAAEQGKFWEMRHGVTLNAAALNRQVYDRLAGELGLDAGRFSACIAADQYRAAIERDMADGNAAGVNGTPTFVLGPTAPGTSVEGRRIVGALPFATFDSQIKALLGDR